ncbi:hypothetical protein [Flexibacterium corallicola]|uniref:hypothetical protein n=1 Tax=Flexibacterium corallicola TaxID=3037259 RepID=UPI00286F12A6|nr:hypothetical protein [Pseudovibrio sp. M1P-2-3]
MAISLSRFASAMGLSRQRYNPNASSLAEEVARDPFSHPDIQRMSHREQSDLPINPRLIRSE